MFVLMIFSSNLKLGHLDSKLGHQAKSKEKLVNTLEVQISKDSLCVVLKVFVLMNSMSSLKTRSLGIKN